MGCVRCQSENLTDFPAQLNIYLDASKKTMPVALSTSITVCFACGYAGTAIHDEELQILKSGQRRTIKLLDTNESIVVLSVGNFNPGDFACAAG